MARLSEEFNKNIKPMLIDKFKYKNHIRFQKLLK